MSALTTVFAQGLAASRPAAASTNNGWFYLATDTNGGTLYQSNGSSWVQCAPGVSGGSTPSTHGCRVYNSGAISTTTAVAKAMTYDTELFDTDSYHDTVTNPSRLTVPSGQAGKYNIFGCVAFATNATGARQAYIQLNGGTVIVADTRTTVGTSLETQIAIATEYPLSVGDYVELFVLQNSGGALNVDLQSGFSPMFGMVLTGT